MKHPVKAVLLQKKTADLLDVAVLAHTLRTTFPHSLILSTLDDVFHNPRTCPEDVNTAVADMTTSPIYVVPALFLNHLIL